MSSKPSINLCNLHQPSVNFLSTIHQLSTHCLPTVHQLSTNCLPTVHQLSINCPPTVCQLSANCLPMQLSANCLPLSANYLSTICYFLPTVSLPSTFHQLSAILFWKRCQPTMKTPPPPCQLYANQNLSEEDVKKKSIRNQINFKRFLIWARNLLAPFYVLYGNFTKKKQKKYSPKFFNRKQK